MQRIYCYLLNDNALGLARHWDIDVDRAEVLLDVAYERLVAVVERGVNNAKRSKPP